MADSIAVTRAQKTYDVRNGENRNAFSAKDGADR